MENSFYDYERRENEAQNVMSHAWDFQCALRKIVVRSAQSKDLQEIKIPEKYY